LLRVLLHLRHLLLLCWLAVAVLCATVGARQLCWVVLGRAHAFAALKRL
jgi:hypothetical protein